MRKGFCPLNLNMNIKAIQYCPDADFKNKEIRCCLKLENWK